MPKTLTARGACEILGVDELEGAITRRIHQSFRCEHDYRATFHADGSTNSLALPLESYSDDEGAAVRAWAPLEAGQQKGVRTSGRALAPDVCNVEFSAFRGGRVDPPWSARYAGIHHNHVQCCMPSMR